MNLRALFGIVAFLAGAFGAPSGSCQSPIFEVNAVNYVRELLKKDIKYPQYLTYDCSTNTLFMKHHNNETAFKLVGAKMNLDTNELETINGLIYVGAVFVDKKTNKIYIETSNSIYKYDKINNKGELYVVKKDIKVYITNMLFVKDDVIYLWAVPPWAVYKIFNGEKSKFEELQTGEVQHLVIDDNDNMFFINGTGLYRQKVGSQEAVYYKDSLGLPYDGITINNAGNIYAFAGSSGIYAVNKNTNDIVKVFDVTAHGMTFDGDDNMVYADSRELYRLKPNNDSNCA